MSRRHNKRAATGSRKLHTFRGGEYVANLMAELNRVAICRRIGEAREQAGLKQTELAELLHVHWRTVQNWESETKPIVPWDRLEELAQATGVTKEWLLHGGDAVIGSTDDLRLLREEVAGVRGELAGLHLELERIRREIGEQAERPADEERQRAAEEQ